MDISSVYVIISSSGPHYDKLTTIEVASLNRLVLVGWVRVAEVSARVDDVLCRKIGEFRERYLEWHPYPVYEAPEEYEPWPHGLSNKQITKEMCNARDAVDSRNARREIEYKHQVKKHDEAWTIAMGEFLTKIGIPEDEHQSLGFRYDKYREYSTYEIESLPLI